MWISEAKAIVRRHQDTIPVDVVAVARDLGATVYDVPDWPDDISGMIRIDKQFGGSRNYIIYVNGNHHPNRQRFTIAHEIAHIMHHSHLIGQGITTDGLYRSGLTNAIEWAANRTAGDILVPWPKIRELMAQGVDSVADLARRFQVSYSTMVIQLDYPRALEWDQPEWEKEKM